MEYASGDLGPYYAAFWRASMPAQIAVSWHLRDLHNYVERLRANKIAPAFQLIAAMEPFTIEVPNRLLDDFSKDAS